MLTICLVANLHLQIALLPELTRFSGYASIGHRDDVAGVSMFPPVPGKVLKFPVIRYTGTSKKPQWIHEEQQGPCGAVAS